MDDLTNWAMTKTGTAGAPSGMESITLADLLARDDLPPGVRMWLQMAAENGPGWARAHNPPAWVGDEECWEKAKRAADHAEASDMYAFASWWYIDHAGCPMK